MPESSTSSFLSIHIDGASRGNPGPAAYAVIIKTAQGRTLTSFSKTLGKTTNNVAEYRALLAALEYAVAHRHERVRLYSDSELLVRQIEGRYKVKSADLRPLHDRAHALILQLRHFAIVHVPREQNGEADGLANQALDAEQGKTFNSTPTEPPDPGDLEKTTGTMLPEPQQDFTRAGQPPAARLMPPALTTLSEEERMFQSAAYEFALKEVGPHVRQMDHEGIFRKDLLEQFFAQGFMGLAIPEEYGGGGGNCFMSVLAIEEFARVDASASVIIDVQNTLVSNALLRWGNEGQKKLYLPLLARNTVGAYALSEPHSGSDAFGLETRAKEKGDGYVLNGRKMWITNAHEAGLFIVFATVNRELGHRGITAFLVERETPGFSIGEKEDKLGIRASSTCELILEDCLIPKANVLGEVGRGYKVAIETLNEGRIGIAAQMTGVARGALDEATAYARERRQFGKRIAEFQAIQFQIARLATGIEAARLMTYNAARLKDAAEPFTQHAAMAKYFASQVAEEVASECVEVFGGYGYTRDYPAEKYLRDAKIGKIYEGTSFMQLQTIAKLILDRR
ncbi:MAG: acyl-CoA dehydrogenase family protein [Terriglobia bacterium]